MSVQFQRVLIMDLVGMAVSWMKWAAAPPDTPEAQLRSILVDHASTMMRDMDSGASHLCGACETPTHKKQTWGFAFVIPLADDSKYCSQPICDECGAMKESELIDLVTKSFAKKVGGEILWTRTEK